MSNRRISLAGVVGRLPSIPYPIQIAHVCEFGPLHSLLKAAAGRRSTEDVNSVIDRIGVLTVRRVHFSATPASEFIGEFDGVAMSLAGFGLQLIHPRLCPVYAHMLATQGEVVEAQEVLRVGRHADGVLATDRLLFDFVEIASQGPVDKYLNLRALWNETPADANADFKAFILRQLAIAGVEVGDLDTALACFLIAPPIPKHYAPSNWMYCPHLWRTEERKETKV